MESKESPSKNARTHTTRKVSSTLSKPVLICAPGPPQGLLKLISMGGTAGKGMNAGGGMERVLYETSGTAASKGGKQFLRVRLRTK